MFPIHVKHTRNELKKIGSFFPTTLDLANILGRMDLDFESFIFLIFGSQNLASRARLGPGSGVAWAGPETAARVVQSHLATAAPDALNDYSNVC